MSAWLLVCAAAPGGCERARGWFAEPRPQVEAPHRHTSGAISLAFPADWTLREEAAQEQDVTLRTLQLESPGEALLILQSFEPALAVDVDEHLERTLQALAAELGARGDPGPGARGEVVAFERALLGAPRPALRATITAPGEWAPRIVELVVVVLPTRTLVVLTTIPEADRARAQPGFDLVLDTLAVADPR